MLSVDEAKKIGIEHCINEIGYDFCKAHEDNGTSAWGERDGFVDCFVGVSPEPAPEYDIMRIERLELTSENDWPFFARCDVYLEDGHIDLIESRIPKGLI